MQQESWRQSQLQVEEPKSTIKHGGPGKTFIFTRGFTYKSMQQESWRQSQLQVEEPKSTIKHGGPGKNFHFFGSGIYLQIDAAGIVASVAAASGRAEKYYKTRWAGKNFHFYSGIYLQIDAAGIVASVAAASGRAEKYYKTRWAGKNSSFLLGDLPTNRCSRNRGVSRSCKWKSRKVL